MCWIIKTVDYLVIMMKMMHKVREEVVDMVVMVVTVVSVVVPVEDVVRDDLMSINSNTMLTPVMKLKKMERLTLMIVVTTSTTTKCLPLICPLQRTSA
jgi:hypothetical protein